jgi:DNA N-6-adenine-methyltransferase (Dam)
MKKGIGSHQSSVSKSDTWLTPPHIIDKLGYFDLDPCTPDYMPWITAKNRYTKKEDGLVSDWYGRVWLNPPYQHIEKWMRKMAEHNNGIAITFARTETKWFFDHVWNKASAILFLKGRIHFMNSAGMKSKINAGAPSVLIAYGKENIQFLHSIPGRLVIL